MMALVRKVTANGLALGYAGAALVLLLSGCGTMNENLTSALVAPGKFDYYSCDQLSVAGNDLSARERELSGLMARAVQGGTSGEFVGAVAYRTELLQARGQLKQIADVSSQKNCTAQSRWQSDRALW